MLRHLHAGLAAAVLVAPLGAQAVADPGAVALVERILDAENRRDAGDPAIAAGRAHADPTVRTIAVRASGRIADPAFTARDALPRLPPPPTWPEPSWRLRHRAVAARGATCAVVRAGLADSAWPVRFRAATALSASCADAGAHAMLVAWAAALPPDAAPRAAGGVSWQGATHALLALARLAPDTAQHFLPAFEAHPVWQVRQYAVRAAATLGDSARLRAAVSDTHPNVRAAALGALATSTNPADRARLVAALDREDVPTVLAAARALGGSRDPAFGRRAMAAWRRWADRGSASERDVREALLAVAGRPAEDDIPAPPPLPITPGAVALAFGDTVHVRVTIAPESGGGSFTVRLRGDAAPIMAARILALVRDGYYDGTTWHRVEHDFVIQGGSPGADEYVGHPRFLRDELGGVPHVRGTVGMSTRGHDTGDAQWFINLRDNLRLNRDYTVFAEVVEGIEVVDGILEGDVIASARVVAPEPR